MMQKFHLGRSRPRPQFRAIVADLKAIAERIAIMAVNSIPGKAFDGP
jgi:hypothetical protein